MSVEKTGLARFIGELRNRRVFRVAAVYLAVGFAVLEATDIVIPMLGLPEIIPVIVLGLLMIGFPIATILSWHYQVTEEGLRKSPKSGEKQSANQKPLTSNGIVVILLVVIVGLLAYPRFSESGPTTQTEMVESQVDPKSVAVLPFTSFADEREDEIFADGMHDDILTQLSKIRDLKVISRTTMMKYKDTQKSIKEIAGEIGVANLLEGSVRRAGDQVRIVAQLINAKTDEHLWAETYDRAYADIFAIQSDVARKIAGALKSALSPEEKANLDEKPTTNMKAYDLFLKGNYYWHTKTTKEGNLKAVAMYEEAIKLDPGFGLAFARQSIAHSVLFQQPDWDPSLERKEFARITLERALALIPDHPETHFAHGIYYLWCLNDRESAIAEFEQAAEGQAKNGEIANHLGQLYAEAGKWTQAGQFLEKAYELDPDVIGHAAWLGGYNFMKRDYEHAEKYYRAGTQAFPENTIVYRFYSRVKKYGFGDLDGARQILNEGIINADQPHRLAPDKFMVAIESREFESALKIVQEDYQGDSQAFYKSAAYFYLGRFDDMAIEIKLAHARQDSLIKEQPDNAYLYARLGMLYAYEGKKSEAIIAGKRAIEIEPVSKNALNGPDHLRSMAKIYSIIGEVDLALDIIEDLLSFPSGFTKWSVKLGPAFDVLRDHPRYQKLIMSNR